MKVVTNNYGRIGRHGYIALWHLQALINPGLFYFIAYLKLLFLLNSVFLELLRTSLTYIN